MVIMDKGYYDYDYQYIEPKQEIVTIENTVKSNDDVRNALARFGWGRSKGADTQSQSAEALQEAVINDIKERKGE